MVYTGLQMNAWVYSYRGDIIENRHRVSLVVMRADRTIYAAAGDYTRFVPLRSSAKAFQAQALFQSGAFDKFKITAEELALACASHEGTPQHTEVAQGLLTKLGLTADQLACGTHLPINKSARLALEQTGESPTTLHNNCSGKHSGMLAVALALGANPQGYETPEHPVQALIFRIMRDLSGVADIPYGIDGCSVPAFSLPLDAAAWMFVQLAAPELAPAGYREGLETTFQAKRTHPNLVAGEGAIDTVLMQTIPGLAVKRGAEGYYGMALRESPHGPLGITLKVDDGNQQVREAFVVRLLEHLGVLREDVSLPWRRPVLTNHRGLETGHIEAVITP
jgi:L-asparaginase II